MNINTIMLLQRNKIQHKKIFEYDYYRKVMYCYNECQRNKISHEKSVLEKIGVLFSIITRLDYIIMHAYIVYFTIIMRMNIIYLATLFD